jgi:hypothetical protein
MGPYHARTGYADARLGRTAGFGDPGTASCRRRANGSVAEWLISERHEFLVWQLPMRSAPITP